MKGRSLSDDPKVGLEIPKSGRVKRLKENLEVINTLHGQPKMEEESPWWCMWKKDNLIPQQHGSATKFLFYFI